MKYRFDQQMAIRLQHVTQGMTYSKISIMTGVSDETARRYIQLGRPTAEFCAKLCAKLGIQGSWLLNGVGCVTVKDESARLLHDATINELVAELSLRMQSTIDQVRSLEMRAEMLGQSASWLHEAY